MTSKRMPRGLDMVPTSMPDLFPYLLPVINTFFSNTSKYRLFYCDRNEKDFSISSGKQASVFFKRISGTFSSSSIACQNCHFIRTLIVCKNQNVSMMTVINLFS